jgi:hypothetical protein
MLEHEIGVLWAPTAVECMGKLSIIVTEQWPHHWVKGLQSKLLFGIASHWLHTIESKFELLHCKENQKTLFTAQ